ncbi:MAG TPA: pentapeptide repeat-containing protein [Candidatus Babeliales bacterium]|nr:pentapeptide repeat-containing protein [Candidatus Babeliales bacterium]
MTGFEQVFVTVASAISATVLNALWQDALLVVCVWLLVRAWPKINAATRYVVWSATLAAAFVLPVFTTLAFFTPARIVTASVAPIAPNVSKSTAVTPTRPMEAPSRALPAALQSSERLRITLSAPLAITVFAVWLLLAGYGLVRLAIGLLRLEQLKRDSLPLPVEYRDSMPQWLRANKGARDVRLCVSDETDVPIAVGLFDAMILIPRSLLDRLSEPEVDQICLHELAHLRRGDDWSNGIQRVINALLGWNPAARFAGQQLDLEREVACDDWVLSYVRQVRPYALCLTKMAENAVWPRHRIPAPGVFDTRKHISLRIERLLGVGRNIATNLAPAPAAAAVGIVGAIALVVLVVVPSVAAAPIVYSPETQSGTTAGLAKPQHQAQHVAVAVTPVPAALASPAPKVRTRPPVQVEVPAMKIAIPATKVEVPATKVEVPATNVEVPAVKVEVPGPSVEIPKVSIPKVPAQAWQAQADAQKQKFDALRLASSISANVTSKVMAGLRGTSIAQGNACVGCDYSGVNWAGRDARGANYNSVDFSKANLAGVNFSDGRFNGVDFSGANLAGASFRNAHLTGCDFTNANLSGVDFSNAWTSGCQFTGARLGSSQLRDVLNGCKGCDFSDAHLSGLDLHGVRINGDDFSGADLRNVNFAGAELVGTDFSDAKMDGVNFFGATINGCDLDGVDLSHVDLSRARIIGSDFSGKRGPPPAPSPPSPP